MVNTHLCLLANRSSRAEPNSPVQDLLPHLTSITMRRQRAADVSSRVFGKARARHLSPWGSQRDRARSRDGVRAPSNSRVAKSRACVPASPSARSCWVSAGDRPLRGAQVCSFIPASSRCAAGVVVSEGGRTAIHRHSEAAMCGPAHTCTPRTPTEIESESSRAVAACHQPLGMYNQSPATRVHAIRGVRSLEIAAKS